jgi:hypothetical protein
MRWSIQLSVCPSQNCLLRTIQQGPRTPSGCHWQAVLFGPPADFHMSKPQQSPSCGALCCLPAGAAACTCTKTQMQNSRCDPCLDSDSRPCACCCHQLNLWPTCDNSTVYTWCALWLTTPATGRMATSRTHLPPGARWPHVCAPVAAWVGFTVCSTRLLSVHGAADTTDDSRSN